MMLSFFVIPAFAGTTCKIASHGVTWSTLETYLEIAERVDLEGAARMHHDRSVSGLYHRRTDNVVARDKASAVVDRARRRFLEVSPVDGPLAEACVGSNSGAEPPGRRELGTRRCRGRAQAQRDDFQSRLAVG